jgi:hypothetical protein
MVLNFRADSSRAERSGATAAWSTCKQMKSMTMVKMVKNMKVGSGSWWATYMSLTYLSYSDIPTFRHRMRHWVSGDGVLLALDALLWALVGSWGLLIEGWTE